MNNDNNEDNITINLTTVMTCNKHKKTTKTKTTEENSAPTISLLEIFLSLVLSHLALHPSPIIDLGTTLYKKFAKCIKGRDNLK